MKITFLYKQNKKKSREFGPYKSVVLMYESLTADGEEIAVFDRYSSGFWQIKEDGTKWSEVSID